ncbi:MAG: hypothetical protein F8N37_24600 [Telmatospirillum sp.]|nr:hypothetical protein [Telmatospirillum sp.]
MQNPSICPHSLHWHPQNWPIFQAVGGAATRSHCRGQEFDLPWLHQVERASPGIRALARIPGRDVKRVHQDVVALEELGPIHRDPESGVLSTGLDNVSSPIRFAA